MTGEGTFKMRWYLWRWKMQIVLYRWYCLQRGLMGIPFHPREYAIPRHKEHSRPLRQNLGEKAWLTLPMVIAREPWPFIDRIEPPRAKIDETPN
jgi:hypothetical protein